MSEQSELDLWRASWVANAPARPLRRERRLQIAYVLGLLFGVVLVVFAAWILHAHRSPEVLAWTVVVWLTTAGSTAFHVWNWRILWRTSSEPLSDFAASQRRLCDATLRGVRFGYAFLALQDTIAAVWLTWDFLRGDISRSRYTIGLSILALLTIAYLVWFAVSRRNEVRRLAQIAAYQRSLG
jgi:hypothetical protein